MNATLNATLNATINASQNLSDHIAKAIVTITPYPTPTPIKGLVYLNGKLQEAPVSMGTNLPQATEVVGNHSIGIENMLMDWPSIDLVKGILLILSCFVVLWLMSFAEKAVVKYWGIVKARREHDKKENERMKP